MNIQYVADWVIEMDDEETDIRARSTHATFKAAHAAAVAGSKKAGALEWISVREQKWVPDSADKRIGRWETTRRWTGDWDHVGEDGVQS